MIMYEQETTGAANDAARSLTLPPTDFTVLIIGDGAERTRALTQIIASPCVSDVIDSGGTATFEMITRRTWLADLGNRDLKDLKSAPSSTRSVMTS